MRTPLTCTVIPFTVLLTVSVARAQETPQRKSSSEIYGKLSAFGNAFRRLGESALEAFYLKKDDLPENKTGSRLWGANYEYKISDTSTFGATYMKRQARPFFEPQRDGLDVYNARAHTAPIPRLTNLALELEYAAERNQDALHSYAWTVKGACLFSERRWEPKLTYRYAFFRGDDPDTARNESFDPLFPGFYDWGTWWQGEIAGEYFVSNSNVKSHLVRLHLAPFESEYNIAFEQAENRMHTIKALLVATLGD
jgi:hypothetical protein